jgi:putative salt-induced outer membrane protein YdiY
MARDREDAAIGSGTGRCIVGTTIRKAAIAATLLLGAAAARADDVGLETGEVLQGRILDQNGGAVVLEHPVLGRLTIPRAKVKFVVTDAEKLAAEAAGRKADAAMAKAAAEGTAAPPAGEPAPESKAEWISKLEVGLNGAGGNNRSKNFIGGVRSERAKPKSTLKFDARYAMTESDGETTQSRFTTGLRNDWLTADPKWSFFGEGRYDRDQFQEWDQRANVAAGAGYKFIEEKDSFVGFRVGGSGTKEWGNSEPNIRPEGLLGVEARYRIDDSKEFTFQSTYYPDITDRPEFRTFSAAGLSVRLDEKGTLNVRFGIEHEYDTHRSKDAKRTDYRYFVLLVMDF